MSYSTISEEYDVYKCISQEFYDDIYSEIDVDIDSSDCPETIQNEKDIDNIISMYSWPERALPLTKTLPRVETPKKKKWWVRIFKKK